MVDVLVYEDHSLLFFVVCVFKTVNLFYSGSWISSHFWKGVPVSRLYKYLPTFSWCSYGLNGILVSEFQRLKTSPA